MAIPLIPLITALTPFVPLITKAIENKKGKTLKEAAVQAAIKSSGVTEASQVSYMTALWFVFQDLFMCGELGMQAINCVTAEHWGALGLTASMAISNAVRKHRKL